MDACEVPAGWMINNKLFMITGDHLSHIMPFFKHLAEELRVESNVHVIRRILLNRKIVFSENL